MCNDTSCAMKEDRSPLVPKKPSGPRGVFWCPPWLMRPDLMVTLVDLSALLDRVAHGFGCCLGL